MFRRVLARTIEDRLLLVLLAALVPLLWFSPEPIWALHTLVDWKTVGALAGLMILSRGLEESGYLALAGRWLMQRVKGERLLAIVLVLFSACLAAVITNDVALFIAVPLTVSLRRVVDIPTGRLVIFEALAVNAGSALSPIGNPQNLFLWQTSGIGFLEFTLMMAPLALALTVLLFVLVPLAFPGRRISSTGMTADVPRHRGLFWVSLLLYLPFLLVADLGYAAAGATGLLAFFLIYRWRLLWGVDWLLLVVFALMFIDMNLLSGLPAVRHVADVLLQLPGQVLTAAVLGSQMMSNVPAAIFLASFTDEWRDLAWGVSVGGFGLAIGSLANLIALRLAREPGLWREFHVWSLPVLLAGWLIALVIGWL
ncbi:SLC13 family permease [Marinobacter nauticus]|uniref:SLC13 family permease n=1 Tax=Marinobacter nauticus TaxID=2743 RepID=UPI001CFEC602|nr:SLC13 family permease [Marinobacter nauticus]